MASLLLSVDCATYNIVTSHCHSPVDWFFDSFLGRVIAGLNYWQQLPWRNCESAPFYEGFRVVEHGYVERPIPSGFFRATGSKRPRLENLRFGVCADLHHDFIADAPRRLSAFTEEMIRLQPDFIIQMGDFCRPEPRNKPIMDIWNRFFGRKYHVLGNHDIEMGSTKEQAVEFWKSEGKYYSLNQNGYHLVVLDGNDRNPEHKTPWQYERYISAEQIQWLEDDLDKTHLPTIVFCHQGLDTEGGIENAVRIRIAFERANQRSGFRKVVLVFSGHHHQDYHNVFNGIHYIQINSASYHWQGHQYAESPFSEELNRKYPLMKYMAHYKDPLWAFVEISSTSDVTIQGRASTFVGKTPSQLGMPADEYAYSVVPFISSRKIRLTLEPLTSDVLR